MASTSAEESPGTDATICPVCCGTLKKPKILLCGHSFCLEPCLKTLLEDSSPTCPLCRQSIIPPSPDAGAEAFPTNFALQSMISTRRKRRLEPPVKINHEECQLHGEKVEVVCETCMDLLCGSCIRLPHDEDHVTKTITEVAAQNFSDLQNIEEELTRTEVLLEENEESIGGTTTKCKTEVSRLQADIDEGVAAVTTLFQEKAKYLLDKVDENLTIIERAAKRFLLKNTNLKHETDYAKYIKDTLMTAPGKSEIQRLFGVRELSTKSQKIRQDAVALRTQLGADEGDLTLPSDIMSATWFGNVEREVERIGKRTQALALQVRAFEHQHQGSLLGFVMFSFDEIYHVSHAGERLSFTQVNTNMNVSRGFVSICGEKSITMCPLLGNGSAILFNSSERVKSVRETNAYSTADEIFHSRGCYYWVIKTANLSHLADPLFRIRAVSWDEFRTNCYAILNDNITIVHLTFDESTLDDGASVKLSEPVYIKSNNEFHVGTSGGMAICDAENEHVKYFARVQSQATRSITSPPELAGGVPRCIISRDSDHKWFVFWKGMLESEFDGIYQYSDDFEIEQFVLNVSNVMSFNFLEDRFLAIHKPHATGEGTYDFQMFVLH